MRILLIKIITNSQFVAILSKAKMIKITSVQLHNILQSAKFAKLIKISINQFVLIVSLSKRYIFSRWKFSCLNSLTRKLILLNTRLRNKLCCHVLLFKLIKLSSIVLVLVWINKLSFHQENLTLLFHYLLRN